MLTLAIVHQHMKTDPGAEDAVVSLYVKAAIKAAETYTGQALAPGFQVDTFHRPEGQRFRLTGTPSGPVTARILASNQWLQVLASHTDGWAYLPVGLTCGVDLLELHYAIGPLDALTKDVLIDADPMIELGILKFATYAYEHRGDDPNRWGTDSGAAELWTANRNPMFG